MSLDTTQILKELAATFAELRALKCKAFPKEIWKKTFSLINQIPIEEICRAIKIPPCHFRKKMKSFGDILEKGSDFVEIKTKNPISPDLITIELETPTGFKAKIQGSSFCLNQVLNGLLGRAL